MATRLRDEVKAVIPHLTRPGGGLSQEIWDVREDLKRVCDRIETEFSGGTSTTEDLELWANSATGNDANPGTQALPLQTWKGVTDALPLNINHNVNIHLEGSFTKPWNENLKRTLGDAVVIIDGGDGLTVVLDNAGSPFVSDTGSVNTIGLSTLSWTLDQYTGYIVEITDGPYAGEMRTITRNSTGGVLSVLIPFSGDPTGAGFRIVKPATVLEETGTPFDFNQHGRTNWSINGTGAFIMQRLTLSGAMPFNIAGGSNGKSSFQLASIVLEKPFALWKIGVIFNQGVTNLTYNVEDPSVLGGGTLLPLNQAGVGSTGGDGTIVLTDLLVEWGGGWCTVDGCFFQVGSFNSSGNWGPLLDKSRVKTLQLTGALGYERSFATNSEFGGFVSPGGSIVTAPPVWLINSVLNIRDSDLSAAYPYGAVVTASQLRFDGTITGTADDFGVWAKDHSRVYFQDGAVAISLAGSIGELTTDGAVPVPWAPILAGTPHVDPNTFTLAKIQPNLGV
jgi:hypothetical protein